MVNSSLDEITTAALGSVEKILNEKNVPESFYSSRMVVEELLQS